MTYHHREVIRAVGLLNDKLTPWEEIFPAIARKVPSFLRQEFHSLRIVLVRHQGWQICIIHNTSTGPDEGDFEALRVHEGLGPVILQDIDDPIKVRNQPVRLLCGTPLALLHIRFLTQLAEDVERIAHFVEVLWQSIQAPGWRRVNEDKTANLFSFATEYLRKSIGENPSRRPSTEVVGAGWPASTQFIQVSLDEIAKRAVRELRGVLDVWRVERNNTSVFIDSRKRSVGCGRA